LKLENIGRCKILRKFGTNAYELELPGDVGISPTFNILDMYPYREDDTERSEHQEKIKWENKIPIAENPHMDKIIDQKIGKKTRRKTYFEYLVKWKGHPIEDSSWVNKVDIQRHGKSLQKFMGISP
jgi:hypothetical protein